MKKRQSRPAAWTSAEIQKIAGIPGVRKKTAYIWEYYKLWIIGIIAAVWFVTFAVHQYTTTLREYWCYIIFNNTYADAGDHSRIWDDFVKYAGFDLREKAVVFKADSYFDYLKGVTGNSYFEAFVAYADSGTLDGITMGTESLAELGKTGRLMDLNREECASIREKYGDRLIYCIPNDPEYGSDPVPIGIDVTDSRLVTQYHVYEENCALGIGAGSGNLQSMEQFLDFIFGGQE